MAATCTKRELLAKVDSLRNELDEARETLRAIMSGEADAIMVYRPEGDRVFTLLDAQQPYRVLVEAMNEGAVTLTAEADILYCNRAAARIVGVSLEKAIGSSMLAYIAPADLEAFRALLKEGMERQAKAELTVITAAGSLVPVYFSVSPSDLGTTPGVCVVATDLSAQKRAERDIVESINEMFCSFDPDFRLTFANSEAARTLGRQRDELIGRYLWEWPDTLGLGLEGEFRRAIAEQATLVFEHYHLPSDRWFEIKLCPASGGGITACFRDISARKRAEAALAQKTTDLERSNSELRQFAYVSAHDLQEPLRMVANFTQLLADRYGDKLDQDARDFIGYAVDGATRMQTLILDLLALSRVGTPAKRFEAVRLDEALGSAVENLRFAIQEAGAIVSHDELPAVMADSSQVVQIFQNLIGNAVKFRSAEPPRVHVSAVRTGDEWTFSVRDNGIGFEPQYVDRIFAVFQRLHTREEYPGTGIGLAICRKIVERHRGRIWAESKPGSGSTFFFTIPAAGVLVEQLVQGVVMRDKPGNCKS
jgi:PAS domain S-box-containing protein